MRCPKCKRLLVNGEDRRYETGIDHAFDPNATSYPLRPTYVCPMSERGCIEGFYDEFGDAYRSLNFFSSLSKKYAQALDSASRESLIKLVVTRPYVYRGLSFSRYLIEVFDLYIPGEKDISISIKDLFWYFTKGKIRFYKSLLFRMSYLLGIRSYAYERKEGLTRVQILKRRFASLRR